MLGQQTLDGPAAAVETFEGEANSEHQARIASAETFPAALSLILVIVHLLVGVVVLILILCCALASLAVGGTGPGQDL